MKINKIVRKPFGYVQWNIALKLIGINVIVFFLTSFRPVLIMYLSLNPILFSKGKMFWQVLTYQFVHGDFFHLFSNMLGVLFFGTSVERRIGSKEFLMFYLTSGILCGLISFLTYYLTGVTGVYLMGASGVVFAILLAYAVLFPDSVIYLWMVVPIPAPILILGYAGIEVYNLFFRSGSGIAHGTHLAGFALAWLYFLIRFGVNPIKVWRR